MKKFITDKLNQAQEQLGVVIPKDIYTFISKLKTSEVKFGEEEWLFWTLDDSEDNNFITESTLDFRNEWKMQGLVFATNGLGDYLVLLSDEYGGYQEKIFVIMHETAEIKLFAENMKTLVSEGPEYYYMSDEYCYKLDDDNTVIPWSEDDEKKRFRDEEAGRVDDSLDEADALRSKLDDLIDEGATDKASEILEGLEKLSEGDDEATKVWSINKLSDLYLRGFGPVPHNLEKALAYNQQAMDLNSHKAYSNRAACYFAGIGMERDLDKALELAMKANEISKSNFFASTMSGKDGGGMYEGLVIMIRQEMKKKK